MGDSLRIITAEKARSEIITLFQGGFQQYLHCGNMIRGSRGIPRTKGWAVVATKCDIIPYRWMFWYETFRGAKTAMRNMEKSFFDNQPKRIIIWRQQKEQRNIK